MAYSDWQVGSDRYLQNRPRADALSGGGGGGGGYLAPSPATVAAPGGLVMDDRSWSQQRGYLVHVPDGPAGKWECLVNGEESHGADSGYHAQPVGSPRMRRTPRLPAGGPPQDYGYELSDPAPAEGPRYPRMRKSPLAPSGGHRSYWLVERVEGGDAAASPDNAVIPVPGRSPGVIVMDTPSQQVTPGSTGAPAPGSDPSPGRVSMPVQHHVHHVVPAPPPITVTQAILGCGGAAPAAAAEPHDRYSSGDEEGPHIRTPAPAAAAAAMPPPLSTTYYAPPPHTSSPRRFIKTPDGTDTYTAPNVKIPPAAVPYRPWTGVSASPKAVKEAETQTAEKSVDGELNAARGSPWTASPLRDAYPDPLATVPWEQGRGATFSENAAQQRYGHDEAAAVILQLFDAHGVTLNDQRGAALIRPWLDDTEVLSAIGKLTQQWVPMTRYAMHTKPTERWFTVLAYRHGEQRQPWLAWFQDHTGQMGLKDRCPLADLISFRCGKNCLGVNEFREHLAPEPGYIRVGELQDTPGGLQRGAGPEARMGRTEGCMVLGFGRRTLLVHCGGSQDRRDLATLFKAVYYINQEARSRQPSPARQR
eukprot:TRINITY_DN4716_c0_g1_i1.p2 TRINITY_DN4716_c0_g1~~TRINITY_DN4716_c0_g1_i1.p2  ORF type:complete len:589 (+),score=146.25 TRINITY_DN4716_c0_g1_i1:71-1837(+)